MNCTQILPNLLARGIPELQTIKKIDVLTNHPSWILAAIINMMEVNLPGCGLPIDYEPPRTPDGLIPTNGAGNKLFVNSLAKSNLRGGYASMPLTTRREFEMVKLMNDITDMSNWDLKVFDDSILTKWKAEVLHSNFTEKMFAWCIAELRHKASIYKRTQFVSVYDADVVKSDNIVPQAIRDSLNAATEDLERSFKLRDWHPGSDGKVLDLVHPSLYPLVYGQTRILRDSTVNLDDTVRKCGKGEVLLVAGTPRGWSAYSHKFQWLPCEVQISDSAKITSYINNLHPSENKDLYKIIESIIDKAIPLWNATLTPLKLSLKRPLRITYENCELYMPERREHEQIRQPEPEEFSARVPSCYLKSYCEEETGELKWDKRVDLRRDFGSSGLQVVVKLANIQLTPEKPYYEGGSWNAEGQLNEHICATALYTYSTSNVTKSCLSFRQRAFPGYADQLGDHQDGHAWLYPVFGYKEHQSAVQEVGDIVTKEGRLITFPNVLQHRVEPFTLADPTRPGHSKTLAIFLVDPNIKIISTANVPCQRRDWWAQEIRDADTAFAKLPNELWDMIVDQVDGFPTGLDEAKELRLELMAERKMFQDVQRERFSKPVFSRY